MWIVSFMKSLSPFDRRYVLIDLTSNTHICYVTPLMHLIYYNSSGTPLAVWIEVTRTDQWYARKNAFREPRRTCNQLQNFQHFERDCFHNHHTTVCELRHIIFHDCKIAWLEFILRHLLGSDCTCTTSTTPTKRVTHSSSEILFNCVLQLPPLKKNAFPN